MSDLERGKNRQLVINMAASLFLFIVTFCIQFFLTPYIVKELGAEAYGFVGLASNILGYTSLISIALNSMAGRFITIAYQSGDMNKANKYYSSVFYSDLFFAGIILIFSIFCVIWLEDIINIPDRLLFDVKLLFCILALNNMISLVVNVFGIATFIKNRLDLSNIRGVISQIINTIVIVGLFALLPPNIWYMGVAGLACTIYYAYSNYQFAQKLTPELKVNYRNFEWDRVSELTKSGIWNLISKLADILGMGLDLLVANLFLGPAMMGSFALSKNVPSRIISVFGTISGNFAPILTTYYAKGQIAEMLAEINKSIRILGFFTVLPLVSLYVFGADFYRLWLPNQDADLLQLITIVGSMELVLSMPLEVLWNIFTITNKMRISTLVILSNHAFTIIAVVVSMLVTEDQFVRLMVLASSRSAVGIIRSATFLPIYGARCLGLNTTAMYRPILKSIVCFAISLCMCFMLKFFISIETWSQLIISGIVAMTICSIINWVIILEKHDRDFLQEKILTRIKNKFMR